MKLNKYSCTNKTGKSFNTRKMFEIVIKNCRKNREREMVQKHALVKEVVHMWISFKEFMRFGRLFLFDFGIVEMKRICVIQLN